MKILLLIISLTFCSFAYADFDKLQNELIGTWVIDDKKENGEWNEFLSPFLKEWKSKLNVDELKKFEKKLLEVKEGKKDKLVKRDKVIKITQDRFFIIEGKKMILDGYYKLYLSKNNRMLLHVYSLMSQEKVVNKYFRVSFDEGFLRIGKSGRFMPEYYSKTE